MKRIAFFNRSTYLWMRDLHLYTGLLLSPFVVLFALTGIFFAHSWNPFESDTPLKPRTWEGRVELPEEGAKLDLAKEAIRQLGLTGEIRVWGDGYPATFSVHTPQREIQIRLDQETGAAELTEHLLDTGQGMAFLHAMPGPHGGAENKRNSVLVRLWGWTADSVVYLLLFLSAGGIYLWWTLTAIRRRGGMWLALGFVSFGGIAIWLL
jgi:hypothetical protein